MMRPLLCVCLLAATGCGLSDYERRMDQVRRRLAVQDEEDRLLGPPLDQPTVRNEKEGIDERAWPFEVFLRLPKGYAGTLPDKEAVFPGPEATLYRYEGPDRRAVLVAAATAPEGGDAGSSPEDFRRRTLQALRTYYWLHLWQRKFVIDFPDKNLEKIALAVPGGKRTLAFEALSLPDHENVKEDQAVHFHAFFHQEGKRRVAVLFQTPRNRKDDPEEARVRNASLATLAFDAEARRRWVEWQQRRK